MASRDIALLEPETRAKVEKFLALARVSGLDLLVTCTVRTAVEQAELYAQGRTKPGRVVTWAKPGQSLHEQGRAVDVVPMLGGKCCWSTLGGDLVLWQQAGALGKRAGLEWAGDWPAKIREFPHFQNKGKA